MNSWYESSVANNIFFNDNGRSVDKIRPEKSMILLNAISKAIDPVLMEAFKINLDMKLKSCQNVNTSFSCPWEDVEKAIEESLGQSKNIECLKKCMETKDWGDTSLQHALLELLEELLIPLGLPTGKPGDSSTLLKSKSGKSPK